MPGEAEPAALPSVKDLASSGRSTSLCSRVSLLMGSGHNAYIAPYTWATGFYSQSNLVRSGANEDVSSWWLQLPWIFPHLLGFSQSLPSKLVIEVLIDAAPGIQFAGDNSCSARCIEASLRRKCLSNITTYLDERSPSSPLSSTECLQLWRGFYVALYMHDSKNALSVQRLIAELANTLRTMDEKDLQLFDTPASQSHLWAEKWMAAFWETLCREWASIDQWRMNKMLLLIRFFIREQFRLVFDRVSKDHANAQSAITRHIQILEAWPLSPRERKVPDGLRLHVLDIWNDELAGQLIAAQESVAEAESDDAKSKKNALLATAKDFMGPVRNISMEALSKGVKIRAKETVKLADEKFLG